MECKDSLWGQSGKQFSTAPLAYLQSKSVCICDFFESFHFFLPLFLHCVPTFPASSQSPANTFSPRWRWEPKGNWCSGGFNMTFEKWLFDFQLTLHKEEILKFAPLFLAGSADRLVGTKSWYGFGVGQRRRQEREREPGTSEALLLFAQNETGLACGNYSQKEETGRGENALVICLT